MIKSVKYNDFDSSLPSHNWFYERNFFDNETSNQFRDLAFGGDIFSTIVEDNGVESAGEAVPVGHPDCKHPFMTLNLNRTMCHFSNRLDVGMHFVKTGGFNGYIEFYERMVTRIIPFRKRFIYQGKSPHTYKSFINLKKLKQFNSDTFIDKVKSVCANSNTFSGKPKDSILNELFQLDILLMLPGQELPMHLNVPYFWGADRNTLPQWVLVAMKNSKLFDHLYIPQVQGISALNTEYNKIDELEPEFVNGFGEGGDFYLYPYLEDKFNDENKHRNINNYVIIKQLYDSMILLDGAEVIHGVDRYRHNDLPPLFSHNHHYTIRFDKNRNKWLLNDFKNDLLNEYSKNDVKLLVVSNTHCFENTQQRDKFHSNNYNRLTLEKIMETFKNDLKSKNRLPDNEIDPIVLWTIVIKEYLKYPTNNINQNSTILGINYCLLPRILPEWVTDNILITSMLKRKC